MTPKWVMFFLGVGYSTAVDMAFQDYRGLEGYIEYVRNYWWDLHWSVGATLAVVALVLAVTYSCD